jgi:hypothetical protein
MQVYAEGLAAMPRPFGFALIVLTAVIVVFGLTKNILPDTFRAFFGMGIVVAFLLLAIALGTDAILHPRRYMNARLRSGGEMLREWNDISIRIFGCIFAGASVWMLYEVVLKPLFNH